MNREDVRCWSVVVQATGKIVAQSSTEYGANHLKECLQLNYQGNTLIISNKASLSARFLPS